MGFGSEGCCRLLENKPEAEAHLPWQLASQRLIKARIPGDTAICQARLNLAGQSPIEHGSERVELLDPRRSSGDAKVPGR